MAIILHYSLFSLLNRNMSTRASATHIETAQLSAPRTHQEQLEKVVVSEIYATVVAEIALAT